MKAVLQAGAIVVKPGIDGPLILIATAAGNPEHWILPKGTIESGETAERAALRELHEETGVDGILVGRAGVKEFRRRGKLRRVEYFVMRYARTSGAGEDRQTKWVEVEQAISLLSHGESRQIVDEARDLIAQAAAAPPAS